MCVSSFDNFHTVSVHLAQNRFDEIVPVLAYCRIFGDVNIKYKISYKIAGGVFAETVYLRISVGTQHLVYWVVN